MKKENFRKKLRTSVQSFDTSTYLVNDILKLAQPSDCLLERYRSCWTHYKYACVLQDVLQWWQLAQTTELSCSAA